MKTTLKDITSLLVLFASATFHLSEPVLATVLTFDVDPPVGGGEQVNQSYGDRVTSTNMPGNLLYGQNGEGFTPNIVVNYGPPAADPRLWNTDYGNLTNVLFKGSPVSGFLQVTFTADPGYLAQLHSWDMAAWNPNFSSDPTINSVRVLDGEGNPIISLSNVTISETARTSFDYSTDPFKDDVLVLEFNSSNLGNFADAIGLDNIVFSQTLVPEPGALLPMILCIASTLLLRRDVRICI
jgi:hypothetical protein